LAFDSWLSAVIVKNTYRKTKDTEKTETPGKTAALADRVERFASPRASMLKLIAKG